MSAPGRPAGGLRTRLALALTLLAGVAAVLLAAVILLSERVLERSGLDAQARGFWLLWIVALGVVAVSTAAWWWSRRIAQRSLQPLEQLVDQIRALDLEQRGARLALASADPELRVIVDALNAQMTALDALVERERAFAAAASHELRTPLTVIGGAAAVLDTLPAVPKPVLGRIERAVRQARQDLEALLALSRSRDALAGSPQRLDLLIQDIAAPHVEGVRARVLWDLQPAERVLAPAALSIVFSNLLRNALRAAGDGTVTVRVGLDAVSVTDDGPGLPPGLLAQAGVPLAPALLLAQPRDGGSGMGLYIAATVAQRQRWTLRLAPAAVRGTRAELCFAPVP